MGRCCCGCWGKLDPKVDGAPADVGAADGTSVVVGAPLGGCNIGPGYCDANGVSEYAAPGGKAMEACVC